MVSRLSWLTLPSFDEFVQIRHATPFSVDDVGICRHALVRIRYAKATLNSSLSPSICSGVVLYYHLCTSRPDTKAACISYGTAKPMAIVTYRVWYFVDEAQLSAV
jgi:hypothetical protein